MRYLVTGGCGFIGSALVRRLAADGHKVSVLDDMSRGRDSRVRTHVADCWHADIRDTSIVAKALHGIDRVVHLAYLQGTQTFYEEPRRVLDVGIRGMLSLLDACQMVGGVEGLMLVSSSEAYQVATTVPTPETVPLSVPDPLNPRYSYGGGKIASELMALAWHQTSVIEKLLIVRPHNIIGPDMGREHVVPQFALRMKELFDRYPDDPMPIPLPFPIQGTGQETRSFCYIDDCVDQMVFLLDHAPAGDPIYHLGNMDERSIMQVAHAVARAYGRQVKVEPGRLPEGSPPRRQPDIAKIMALGYKGPKVAFPEAIDNTVRWYQANG